MFASSDRLPRPANPDAAKRGLDNWREATSFQENKNIARFATDLATDPAGRQLLEAVFGNSPYLSRCLLAEMPFVQSLMQNGPDEEFSSLIKDLRVGSQSPSTRDAVMQALRTAKRRTALLTGLADIAGMWSLEQITAALTGLAEAAIDGALAELLREAAAADVLRLADAKEPVRGCGLTVLGMGKLGGGELNYSSDIDLILLYDPDRVPGADRDEIQDQFNRLARDLLRVLQEHTADGYVFRTDLRLRPDPGATPPVMSVLAAETYYESMGQNWERAAFVKARPVAGDRDVGAEFLERLKPFIWRKNLDFAAIQDIHSIKRQIAAHRGGSRIAVAGHNVKLGRGGIREIEFFAQTQQLIWGGRDPNLRTAGTCESLRALATAGRITDDVVSGLSESYRFLRRVEHRLQMIDDQQTHSIPRDPDAIAALAIFLGYPNTEAFSTKLLAHLHRVEDHYAHLFEEAAPLSGPGNLVFTGSEHDPDTIETISGLGFEDADRVSTIVRQWHHGRYRATSTVRAREILTELVPSLLSAFARTANADGALLRFDDFLGRLPAGVQLFSLFQANPHLLDLVAEIMGSAPYLAERLARNTALLDVMLDADFMAGPPNAEELRSTLRGALGEARDFEDILDITRRWTNERKFQAGMQILRGITDGDAAGVFLAGIADTALGEIQGAVEDDFARRHGRVSGAGLCVIAYGKHGGRELMPGSDLDAVFVFDSPEDVEASDGAKPLSVGHYFARLGQSLISAISVQTSEGRLYEIDMRLRPSGEDGPLVPLLDGYGAYLRDNAWTWEHMALTRARPVTGPAELKEKVGAVIREVLTRPRDADRLLVQVAAMRARIAVHHKAKSIWDIKHWPGGLVDIEFMAQYLMLRHATAQPQVLDTNTTEALAKLRDAECIEASLADPLIAAMRLWRRVHSILRLTFGSRPFHEEELPAGLRDVLVRAGHVESFAGLKDKMAEAAAAAHAAFEELITKPAAALPAADESENESNKGHRRMIPS